MKLTYTMKQLLIQARDFGMVEFDEDERTEGNFLRLQGLLSHSIHQVTGNDSFHLTAKGEKAAKDLK